MQKKNYTGFELLFAFLSAWVLLFLLAPLVSMFLHTEAGDLMKTFNDKEVQQSIWLTLSTSMAATLAFAVLTIPLAYLLARKKFRLRKLVLALVNLPVVIPHTAAGIAVLGLVSRNTLLGRMAESIGLGFIGSPLGISLAMAFVSLPFLINAAVDGFSSVPERYEKAALNLGASKTRMFFTIALPLAWRSILTGIIMMFSRGLSEFGAVVIIAYHPMTTPVLIFDRFNSFGLSSARPISVIFILICLLVFIALRYLANRKSYD